MRNVAACVCVGLVLIGCSSFTSTPAVVSSPDDAGVDAALDAGAPLDAMPVDPVSSYCSTAPSRLCADFDVGVSFGSWTVAAGTVEPTIGSIARSETSGHDSTAGVHATLLAGSALGGAIYGLDASSGDRVFLEADIRVAAPRTFDANSILTVLAIQRGDSTGTRVEATIGQGSEGMDYLLRLHAKTGASDDKDDLVARLAYGQWNRIRIESDLVGTTPNGNARLTVLTTTSTIGQTLARVIPTVDQTESVVGLSRGGAATSATVEADFDNLVGGSF